MELIAAIKRRLFGPTCEDGYFGKLRFAGDHWIGSAPGEDGIRIEVMLIGTVQTSDFSRYRARYEELQARKSKILKDAQGLIESYFDVEGGERALQGFLEQAQLVHVMLPNPQALDAQWDITVSGPWSPSSRQRGDEEDRDGWVELMIQLDEWTPVSVERA